MRLERQLKNIKESIKIHSALDEVKNSWLKKFDTLTVETPDEALNLMVNKWLKYQAICGRLMGSHSILPAKRRFWFQRSTSG